MEQIATFHTHLGALRFEKKLLSLGDNGATMMPVPRKLSASCGTCVRFERPFEKAWANEDLDAVYLVEAGGYRTLYQAEEE
jgi:hypothetical protein